jgi:uncharacterized membrane protein HdeD (DUF308 family)
VIDWRLVTNLVFLLLLLLTAREHWLGRASDEQLARRAYRKQVLGGMALFAGLLALCSLVPRLMSEKTFVYGWSAYIVGGFAWAAWREERTKRASRASQGPADSRATQGRSE